MSAEAAPSAYVCVICGRRFVVVADETAAPPRCVCGADLAPDRLARGVYPLHGARADAPVGPTRREADVGYGPSHGYGPAHGGPSGPGDAPAKPRASGAHRR